MPVWTITPFWMSLVLGTSLAMISSVSPAIAQKPASAQSAFAGQWVHRENPKVKMSVREDNGVFRVTGGDESYGYNLSCLFKNMQAVCGGSGGQLEGQNFLYQSTIGFRPEGLAIESWKAFNNLQTVSGQIIWKRP